MINEFFHKINRTVEGKCEIGVGEAYGITRCALFVYPTRQDAKSGLPLQGFVIKHLQISPFKTILDVPPDMAAMTSQDAVAQVRVGVHKKLFQFIFLVDRGKY